MVTHQGAQNPQICSPAPGALKKVIILPPNKNLFSGLMFGLVALKLGGKEQTWSFVEHFCEEILKKTKMQILFRNANL